MLATMEVTQMSNNVLILDAGCQNFGKGGELNHYLSRLAEGELTKLGWNVEITLIDSQWEIAAEAEKIFPMLMGTKVGPRREFIEENAKFVENLDL